MGAPRKIAIVSIHEAALKVFSEHGFSGTSIAAVAREAGTAKANIHYYFSNKETLYQSVLHRAAHEWLGDARLWLDATQPASAALKDFICTKLALSKRRPNASRLFSQEIISGAPRLSSCFSTTLKEAVTLPKEAISIWMSRGELPQADPLHVLFCLWSMTLWYAGSQSQVVSILGKPGLDPDDYETASETILALVLRTPSGKS